MASTYSTNLAIELIGTGEQSGTWGASTNTNLGTLIEQAISGYVTQAITDGSGANTTITIPNGATGVARNMFIEMTGALTFSTTSLIVPANKKMYFIFNNTSGGFAVTVKVSGQTGVLVPNGKKVILTSNGTDIVEAANQVVGAFGVGGTATMAAINASGTVAMAGAATVGTTLGVTGLATLTGGASYGSNTTWASDNTFNIGAIGANRPANIYVGTAGVFGGSVTVGTTLGVTGNITVGAGSKFTTDAGNDLNLDAPSSRSLFLKIGGSTKVTVDNAGAVTIPGNLVVTGQGASGRNIDATGTAGTQRIRAQDTTTGGAFLEAWNNGGTNALTLGIDSNAGALTGTANQNFVYGSGSLKIFTNNGTLATTFSSTGVTIPGTLGVTGITTIANGTVAAPSLVFAGDADSGFFKGTGASILAGLNGTEVLNINTSTFDVKGGLACNFPANVSIVGALSKGSGSFRIAHPLPALNETHDLVHSFIEGPQADLIYRGRVALVDGKATVNIDAVATMSDGTFETLCRDVQCFTSNETDWSHVRGFVAGNILTIECQDTASIAAISWMVIGERQDKHMMDTTWTDDNGKVIVEPLKPIPSIVVEEDVPQYTGTTHKDIT